MYGETDWRTLGEELPLNRKVRAAHGCAGDKSLIVSRNLQGISAYCFRCGNVGFQPTGTLSLSALRKEFEESNALARQPQSMELPNDLTQDFPPEASAWLRDGGVWAGVSSDRHIAYSPSLRRVVLVCRDKSGAVIYWQARAIYPGQSPKYANPSTAKEELLVYPREPTDALRGGSVCITEDYLSAYRVGQLVPCCTALGTKLSDQQARQLARDAGCGSIYIWLDPDRAGETGSTAMRRKLLLLSDSVQIIKSAADPKQLSRREIAATLKLEYNNDAYRHYD